MPRDHTRPRHSRRFPRPGERTTARNNLQSSQFRQRRRSRTLWVPEIPHHEPVNPPQHVDSAVPASSGPGSSTCARPGLQRAPGRREEWVGADVRREQRIHGQVLRVSSYAAPILTGNQQWKPGQDIVFYVLTKQYYPVTSQIHSGFKFNLGGASSVAIPGPSGIFLRMTYNTATFARALDSIVAFGVGAQGGKGVRFGMPDTAIYAFLSAKTEKMDFGGYF